MTYFEKIKAFAKNKGITLKFFIEKTGLSAGFFITLRKKGGLTLTSLAKIIQAFPDFDWVGFILSENAQEWQKCLEAVKSTPPPTTENINKKQISQRLLTFFKEFEINNWALHVACGFGHGFIGSLQRGTAGFTAETLLRIFKGFPDLNPKWLILGEGEMIKKNSQKQIVNKTIEEIFLEQLETMELTETKLLESTQEMKKKVAENIWENKSNVLKWKNKRKNIYSLILIQQQQLKKLIKEYNENNFI